MAYVKIKENKKGELVAKIQVSGKDPKTGESKVYSKRIYNEDGLTPSKFERFAKKVGLEFEEEVEDQYNRGFTQIRTRVLTFNELATEWIANIHENLSHSYYLRAIDAVNKFNEYLKKQNLFKQPISSITVRDIQLFINSMDTYYTKSTAKLIHPLPATISFRELDRENIITRCSSYGLNNLGKCISIAKAKKICEFANIDYDDYFVNTGEERKYSTETVKGTRRVIRAIFNEAIRYEWITKNPVVLSKIGAGNGNVSLKAVKEKEVFSEREAQAFLCKVDALSDEFINRKICMKLLLLTGLRIAELNGLKWCDIDYAKRVVHVRRNRLYASELGYYEKDPKTKTSIRDIPLPDALLKDLKRYEEWFRIADDNFDFKLDEYYIASSIYRTPLGSATVGQWLNYYEKKWGSKKISCHGMRHTYCSLLLMNNVPIQTVSKYMGHSDSTVTLKVYSHFIPESQDKVIYVLNNIVDRGDE